jgi:hypothetical protein
MYTKIYSELLDILKWPVLRIPEGGKLSSLLVQMMTCVLLGPPIPHVAAMEQKFTDRRFFFVIVAKNSFHINPSNASTKQKKTSFFASS